MKQWCFLLLLLATGYVQAQELFVSSEPASNMPARSLGIRLNNHIMPPYDNHTYGIHHTRNMYRFNPELLWGIHKTLMLRANFYGSNMHQERFRFEGAGFYIKHRFLSIDGARKHFRMASFLKGSLIDNPISYHEINPSGDNTSLSAGLVATQLLHKLAVSFTGTYTRGFDNLNHSFPSSWAKDALGYSLSSGYLVLPVKYKSYRQVNLNTYAELLGRYHPLTGESFLDIAPALQLILQSRMRLDIGFRRQLAGNMRRINDRELLLRFEYNIFNAYPARSGNK